MKHVNSQQDLADLVSTILADQAEEDCTLCSAIYVDICCRDSIGVRWMEADGNSTMNRMIEHLDTELFRYTGRYFNICNNSPTDGFVLIFWEEMNDEPWERDGHKIGFIKMFESWQRMTPAEQEAHFNVILFETLEGVIDRECVGSDKWHDWIDPDHEMWYQVMCWNLQGKD